MLKRLAISVWVVFVSVGILTAQNPPPSPPKQGIAIQETSKKGQEQPQAQPHNQTAPNLAASTPQPTTPPCDEACQQGRDNLKVQNRLAWLTFGLVVVGAFQVGGMIWQAILIRQTRSDVHTQAEWMKTQAGYMKDQTEILRDSVRASQTSADAAMAQIQLMKEKERAIIAVKMGGVEVKDANTEFWSLTTSLEIRNLGQNRAFIVEAMVEFTVGVVTEEPRGKKIEWALLLPEEFIDPSITPVIVTLQWSPEGVEPASLKELADDLRAMRRRIRLRGRIEYTAAGMNSTEEFDSPWFTPRITTSLFGDRNVNPTDAERIEDGWWWGNSAEC